MYSYEERMKAIELYIKYTKLSSLRKFDAEAFAYAVQAINLLQG
jgi:hypothetical protein